MNGTLVQVAHPEGHWSERMSLTKAMQKFHLHQINHRTLFPYEIVIDIDVPAEVTFDVKEFVISKILVEPFNVKGYTLWRTGSWREGNHIHLKYPGLQMYPKERRIAIRKEFLNALNKVVLEQFGKELKTKYPIDLGIASENRNIRREFSVNEKTNMVKHIIEYRDGFNVLPDWALTQRVEYESPKDLSESITYGDATQILQHPVMQYVLRNKIPRGGRHTILLKSLGIMLSHCKGQLTTQQLGYYCTKISRNCDRPDNKDIRGWIKWAESGNKRVNHRELLKFIQLHRLDLLKR